MLQASQKSCREMSPNVTEHHCKRPFLRILIEIKQFFLRNAVCFVTIAAFCVAL
jgi:hypothetical protein